MSIKRDIERIFLRKGTARNGPGFARRRAAAADQFNRAREEQQDAQRLPKPEVAGSSPAPGTNYSAGGCIRRSFSFHTFPLFSRRRRDDARPIGDVAPGSMPPVLLDAFSRWERRRERNSMIGVAVGGGGLILFVLLAAILA